MAGVNKVILVGNVGKDPEIRTLGSGDRVANFSLATSESWRDKATGERMEKSEWHRVVVFNDNLVKLIENYVRKGSKLYVEGALQTRKWADQNGIEKYSTEVVIKSFGGAIQLLDSKGAGGGSRQHEDEGDTPDFSGGSTKSQAPAQAYDLDDEIPF